MKIKLFTVPNLLTLSNLLCGAFASLAALVYGSFEWAFWLIVLAAVFDFFDDFVAPRQSASSSIRWPTWSPSDSPPRPWSTR